MMILIQVEMCGCLDVEVIRNMEHTFSYSIPLSLPMFVFYLWRMLHSSGRGPRTVIPGSTDLSGSCWTLIAGHCPGGRRS
jgi:hypothetical protein